MLRSIRRRLKERREHARLEKRLEDWGRERRSEVEEDARECSRDDAGRIVDAVHNRLDAEAARQDAFGLSSDEVAREFDAVVAPYRHIDEALEHIKNGLDAMAEVRSFAVTAAERHSFATRYSRQLVEATTKVSGDDSRPFQGIGDLLWKKFPRLSQTGSLKKVPFPIVVAFIFLSGCATAYVAAEYSLIWALPLLLITVFFDCLDGVLVRQARRQTGAGALVTCLVSHFVDVVMLYGLAEHVRRTGDTRLALVIAGAGAIAIFSSYARCAALRVGQKIDRPLAERAFRLGGLALAFATQWPWIAVALIVGYSFWEVGFVIVRVSRAEVWAVAVAVDGPDDHEDDPRAWTWTVRSGSGIGMPVGSSASASRDSRLCD